MGIVKAVHLHPWTVIQHRPKYGYGLVCTVRKNLWWDHALMLPNSIGKGAVSSIVYPEHYLVMQVDISTGDQLTSGSIIAHMQRITDEEAVVIY